MANVIINDTHLTNIADAIREKTGTSDTYKPGEMATAIQAIEAGSGGGGVEPPEEAYKLTGDCVYRFYNGYWDWFIEQYGDKITTENISNANYMFYQCGLEKIPFDINLESKKAMTIKAIFAFSNLKELPKLTTKITTIPTGQYDFLDISDIFTNMKYLREIPYDYLTSCVPEGYWQKRPSNGVSGACSNCFSLRKQINIIPFMNYGGTYYNRSAYYSLYNCCHTLDEVINLPVETGVTYTNNAFSNTFKNCYRIKDITFETSSTGAPAVVNWKSQKIDLTTVGFAPSGATSGSIVYITGYNSGITTDKEIKDYDTYIALKDDPDCFTLNKTYSRYTRSSAVRTINSLPDTSAYLAANGGTNTISFEEWAGSNIDGEAMNTMTEAEIAVAAAKGWTVAIA